MTIFESKTELKIPVSEVYNFLADFNNHQSLMPEDNIYDWTSDKDTASFNIQHMLKLELTISNRIPNKSIIIIPVSQAPFQIEMNWIVKELDEHITEAILTISAELNMMMKMMASKPLQKLTDHQIASLKTIMTG